MANTKRVLPRLARMTARYHARAAGGVSSVASQGRRKVDSVLLHGWSWVTGCSGPIWPMPRGRNGADVRESYGLTMLRPRTSFVVLAGRVLPYGRAASGVFRQRIRTRPSARPCRSLRRAAGIGPEVGTSVRPAASACGRCLRRGGAARTWSRPRAVAAGPASRWRRAGRGLPGARLPRVSVRGRGPRGAPCGSGCVVPTPAVRPAAAAAGRGLYSPW